MKKTAREAHHLEVMNGIRSMQVIDRTTKGVDQERTTIRVAELMAVEVRAFQATERGCEAMERLLTLSEGQDSGQISSVAKFLAAIWGVSLLDPSSLRSLDQSIGDDCIAVLDAVRWGRISVGAMADDADLRMPTMLRAWQLIGNDSEASSAPV